MTTKEKITSKKANVAVVGLGYVGLPLALTVAKAGFSVIGIEKNEEKLALLKKGKSYIEDVQDNEVQEKIGAGSFTPSSDLFLLKECEVILVCVPTPLDAYGIPDTRFIKSATEDIAPHVRKGSLVILESTTYPGCTEELVKPMLEKNGLKAGVDFYLVFSPERIDPGNKSYPLSKIPKVVGGINKESSELAALFYAHFTPKPYVVSSLKAAEMTKLLENIFRLVNISFINELKLICDKMDIDIWEVIEAAKTKPYGFMPFYPGPGVGGHCFEANQTIITIDERQNIQLLTAEKLYESLTNDYETAAVRALARLYAQNDSLPSVIFGTNASRPIFSQTKTLTTQTQLLEPSIKTSVVSFDPIAKKPSLQPITLVSKRTSDHIFRIACHYNYEIRLTGRHPLFVRDSKSDGVILKYAEEVSSDDFLAFTKNIPSLHKTNTFDLVDIVKTHYPQLISRLRVKPQTRTLKTYKPQLDALFIGNDRKRDYLKHNYLPLDEYLKHENSLPLSRKNIFIASGRGPSFSQIPALITLDTEWARLIGYYLSEGCVTKDGATMRIRFTFHIKETEYISDVETILKKKNIAFSSYKDKQCQSYHIKVSSLLLGLFFVDILRTGRNCYDMQIPVSLFFSTKLLRQEVLKGLLRGDGGVYLLPLQRKYRKNARSYTHQCNAAEISYFTSSPLLFEQVQLILHENGILPHIKRRKGLLAILGNEDVKKTGKFFIGKKRELIETYLACSRKKPNFHLKHETDDYIFAKVEKIEKIDAPQSVYSFEVDTTGTLLVQHGVFVHNCIPEDPFYLSWKAREYGFYARFIELAGEINNLMPHAVVTKVIWALNQQKKSLNGVNILVLGVAYKKDIGDMRQSPALNVMWDLLRKKADLSYHDPFVPRVQVDGTTLSSLDLTEERIKKADLVLILTDHSSLDYEKIAKQAKLIVDTRHAVKTKHPHVIT